MIAKKPTGRAGNAQPVAKSSGEPQVCTLNAQEQIPETPVESELVAENEPKVKSEQEQQQQQQENERQSNGDQVAAGKRAAANSKNANRRQRRAQEKRAKMDMSQQNVSPSGLAKGQGVANPRASEECKPRGEQEENTCAGCLRPIRDKYLLMVLDKRWHEDCLKCVCCNCRLGEVGSSLFAHSGRIFCRRDFLRIYGCRGLCAACKKEIPPYELVMRANENAYHMECFACQQCQYRFCVGDRFHLTESRKIMCLSCHSDQSSQVSGWSYSAPANGTDADSPVDDVANGELPVEAVDDFGSQTEAESVAKESHELQTQATST